MLILAFALFSGAAFGSNLTESDLTSLAPGLTPEQVREVLSTGETTRFFEANQQPLLVPRSALKDSLAKDFQNHDHTVGVEALFVAKADGTAPDDQLLKWYNILRSVSTMKGIQYYSVTHHRTRVLFLDSYVIDNASDQRQLPDPL
ncbi:MAG TPA: DUF6675 family protein, partial [Spirochaetia bacterium]|nr:DUF6675 family protein [Spirochaetia bacterium]